MELEPWQRREVRQFANEATGGEFDLTTETSARRGSTWGALKLRTNTLSATEQQRFEGLAQKAQGAYSKQDRRAIVDQYYRIKSEMGTRRNEARENLGTEREFEAEGPMEEALNGYYELGAEASDAFGNFDVEKYQDLREAYQATLTQRSSNTSSATRT